LMAVFSSGIFLYATIITAIVLLALSFFRVRGKERKEQEVIVLYLAAGLILFFIQGVSLLTILALEIGILTFNGLLSGRTSRRRGTYVTLCLLYIALIHWVGFVLIAQALLIGLLSVVTKIKQYKNSMESKRVEVERDIVHIAAGMLLITIFYLQPEPLAITFQILLIFGGVFAISMTEKFRNKGLSRMVYGLERNGAALGHGALWLALGSLFAVSFLNTPDVLAVFGAIFIGDPLATIVGMHVKSPRLPYNRKKSVAGTLSYFIATAAIGYLFIGPYALIIGAVAAIVESSSTRIDDNFSVAVVATILLYALSI